MKFYAKASGIPELLRLGAGNPSSLRPRPRDRETGFSCFDTVEHMIRHFEGQGRPLPSGEPFVALDTAGIDARLVILADAEVRGHFFVSTHDPQDMADWINSTATVHPLTQSLIDAIKPPKKRRTP